MEDRPGRASATCGKGLAQVAVGLTHAHRGNARGAVALLSRGVQRVRAYQAASPAASPGADDPYGIDLAAFLAASDDLAARIDRDGLAGIPAADLRLGPDGLLGLGASRLGRGR